MERGHYNVFGSEAMMEEYWGVMAWVILAAAFPFAAAVCRQSAGPSSSPPKEQTPGRLSIAAKQGGEVSRVDR